MMECSSGHMWLDLGYILLVVIGFAVIIFKPFKQSTEDEKKAKRKIVGYGSRAGRKGRYYTKGEQDFTINMFIYGFCISIFILIIPCVLERMGLI